MEVRAIMTPDPVRIDRKASLDDAMRMMDDHEIRHLPVMDGPVLVGVISDRDLLRRTGWLPEGHPARTEKGTVGDSEMATLVTCTPDDSVVMVSVDLSSRRLGCLPVLENGALVGMVTEMDLLDGYLGLSRQTQASAHLEEPVSSHMSRDVTSLSCESTMEEAIRLERARGVRHFPVVEGGNLVGIVSDRDLRKAIGRHKDLGGSISKVMRHDVLTLRSKDPLAKAAAQMLECRISSMPVVDGSEVVGMLTMTDLLDNCIDHLRAPDRA